MLLCLVCLFDLACFFLSSFLLISHLKTCTLYVLALLEYYIVYINNTDAKNMNALPVIVTMVPTCPISGSTLVIRPGTKYVQSLPLDSTMADVVAVMTTATDVSEVTPLDCILTLIRVLVLAV